MGSRQHNELSRRELWYQATCQEFAQRTYKVWFIWRNHCKGRHLKSMLLEVVVLDVRQPLALCNHIYSMRLVRAANRYC